MISLSTTIRAWRARSDADPAEQVLADLRRLGTSVRHNLPGGWTRRVALLTAYEDALLLACELSGLDATALHDLVHRPVHDAMSAERDLARIRTEADLEAAGITIVARPDP